VSRGAGPARAAGRVPRVALEPGAAASRIGRLPRSAAVTLIEAYRTLISPFLPRACRYLPSCSEYGAIAIDRHGLLRGTALTLRRLLRCHPFASGGYDPVG
jgi:uncharacterized protein